MNEETLALAISAAQRFIETARKAVDELNEEYPGNKNTAAARRASMDLTRALADVRKPG